MLQITLPVELWDEGKQEFVYLPGQTLELEHSLVSLSKWEAKWHKPFLTKSEKTVEETIDYIRCMTITKNVDPEVYDHITADNIREVYAYIEDPMTATTFSNDKQGRANREIVTAELIYYWMIALNVPAEFQKWHLNRLITLIRVCNIKNSPPKKMSKRETINQMAALNAARKQKYDTNG